MRVVKGRQAGCLEIVLVHTLDGRITHQAMAKTVAALEPAGLVRRDPARAVHETGSAAEILAALPGAG